MKYLSCLFVLTITLTGIATYAQQINPDPSNICRTWERATFDKKKNLVSLDEGHKGRAIEFYPSGSVIFFDTKSDKGKFAKWKYDKESTMHIVTDNESGKTMTFKLVTSEQGRNYLLCKNYHGKGVKLFVAPSEKVPYVCPTYE